MKNLVLTHITEQFDKPGMRERVIGEIARVYQGNLFFGEDLMEIPVMPAEPGQTDVRRPSERNLV